MTSPAPPSSSSSTLWATASKEWVIPAKPKPGRKPKKDTSAPAEEVAEVDSKGRRVQNRAAQRAFRERKQSQLAELQARVQQYEQGEVERNVQLQNIAKRLKDENENLKAENATLKEKIEQLQRSFSMSDGPKKRHRDSVSQSSSVQANSRKKIKTSPGPPGLHSNGTYASTPSSLVSSPSTTEGHSAFSPMPSFLSNQDVQAGNGLGSVFDAVPEAKHHTFDAPANSCGFCNEAVPCLCNDMQLEQTCQQLSLSTPPQQKLGTISLISSSTVSPEPSILDNLPAYQPPVPIRRRATNASFNPVFPVYASTSDPPGGITPSCSGDPLNCLACADDAFGKAFCSEISKSVAASATPCKDCPSRTDLGGLPGCCGNPGLCGSSTCGPTYSDAPGVSGSSSSSMLPDTVETMPTDHAWRQIKLHPNVGFSDLSLLADVVARRAKCVGPHMELALAQQQAERDLPPREVGISGLAQHAESNAHGVLLTDPHAHYHEARRRVGASPPPRLVPQEVLIRCGRRRVREVMADGVRDALRLLDAKFSI